MLQSGFDGIIRTKLMTDDCHSGKVLHPLMIQLRTSNCSFIWDCFTCHIPIVHCGTICSPLKPIFSGRTHLTLLLNSWVKSHSALVGGGHHKSRVSRDNLMIVQGWIALHQNCCNNQGEITQKVIRGKMS